MKVVLDNINELYSYNNIKEYINIYLDNDIVINRYKIEKVVITGINYQLYSIGSGVFTLAYSRIPDYIKYVILNNRILVKIFNKNSFNNQINIPLDTLCSTDEYSPQIFSNKEDLTDEETADTSCDD